MSGSKLIRARNAEPEPQKVGARLRRLRKQHGVTQSELARQIGIQQSDLSRMEKGEYRVSLDNLFKILSVFGLGVAEFFAAEEASTPPVQTIAEPLSREDMQTLQQLKALSPEARQEVHEFIDFKLRREQRERALAAPPAAEGS
jgi:transcriptional regulator with XRE-family HTH domain